MFGCTTTTRIFFSVRKDAIRSSLPMYHEKAIGITIARSGSPNVRGAYSWAAGFESARKTRMLTSRTHAVPPDVPVNSYHCIHEDLNANTFPRVSQVQLMSHRVCACSQATQT